MVQLSGQYVSLNMKITFTLNNLTRIEANLSSLGPDMAAEAITAQSCRQSGKEEEQEYRTNNNNETKR